MPIAVGIGLGISAIATVASMSAQKKASRDAAAVDTAVAGYNARVDETQAEQLALDTEQNIKTERQNDAVYLSRMGASYAASGVLATTGSPLHAQITTAGRMEQQVQQQYANSQAKQQQIRSAAAVGRLYGDAQAKADTIKGNIAMIDGGAKLAGMAFSAYNAGMFSGGGGAGGSNNPSASFYGADTGAGTPDVSGYA